VRHFKNDGELELVLITHHYDEIIPAQDFEKMQQIKNKPAKCSVTGMRMNLSFRRKYIQTVKNMVLY
jgi:hypothetical protein